MCGCHDCKSNRQPVIIIDWSQIPNHYHYITIDSASGEIWLATDKMVHSVTSDGGKWMPSFPIHDNEKQTLVGWATQLADGSWKTVSQDNPWEGITSLQIGVAWDKVGKHFENAIANRPCKSRS